jgi:signal transduction histidine kinase
MRVTLTLLISSSQNEEIKFEVRDTGIAINQEIKNKNFLPCEKVIDLNNNQGCGLGLSIVKHLTS